jgi:hypothetical protein
MWRYDYELQASWIACNLAMRETASPSPISDTSNGNLTHRRDSDWLYLDIALQESFRLPVTGKAFAAELPLLDI